MHKYRTSKYLDRILIKLQKKNEKLYENLLKKMNEIINNPNLNHYKNLRHDMKKYKRVQVGSFVLIFHYNKKEEILLFDDFDHHDKIYK